MTRRIRDKCNFKTCNNNEESREICNRDNNIVLVNHDKCHTEENTGVMLILNALCILNAIATIFRRVTALC